MNDDTRYIYDAIRTYVWSGFHSEEDVHQIIDDLLEGEADVELLRSLVAPEFLKKREAETTWPAETDCDRLDKAFAMLEAKGVIALHNTGFTISDGLDDVGEALQNSSRALVRGYCFYHGQDVERAVGCGGLMLAFGDIDAEPNQKVAIGYTIRDVLEECGFVVDWDGKPEKRIGIPRLKWQRRCTV